MHPILFHAGPFVVPTFAALAAVGLICGLLLSERTARLAGVDPGRLWDAGLFAVIAAFVFSRVLLVVEHPRSFLEFPALLLAVPSLTASGLLLTVVATGAWSWWKQIPLRSALDAWAPCGALVWGFLAVGHYAEGSDPGMVSRWGWAHPVALYAAGLAFAIAMGAYVWLRRARPAGETAGLVLMAGGVGQFLLCFVRVPGMEFVGGLDVLEWVSVGMMVVGGALLLIGRKNDLSVFSSQM